MFLRQINYSLKNYYETFIDTIFYTIIFNLSNKNARYRNQLSN
ncbi:hypothetical protein FLAVO9AF_660009 [Flavobacterium sp. 9AF]|nr:hypothetical protein FLAVO9AF_660009 [Flavobacterium sp. 9AF]